MLREPADRYWAAMKTANEELNRRVASGGIHVSPLKVRPFDPPLPVVGTADIRILPDVLSSRLEGARSELAAESSQLASLLGVTNGLPTAEGVLQPWELPPEIISAPEGLRIRDSQDGKGEG